MAPKELSEYMSLDYTLVLKKDEDGDWVATVKELDGCIADGETPEEAIKNLESMKELWLRARLRSKRPVPLPEKDEQEFSGKFLQRVPKNLHRKLVRLAEKEGVSLNQFVTAVLAEAVGHKAAEQEGIARTIRPGAWDHWCLEKGRFESAWETSGHRPLDHVRRNHSIQTLTRMTPITEEGTIGREQRSGNQENHEVWNNPLVQTARR
jgi:predicted RNase H-like HicB family nuclease